MDTLTPTPHQSARRWHRRFAWVALFALLGFATTGVLHPLMTRWQPQPAKRQAPPLPPLALALPAPVSALAAAGVDTVQGLKLLHDGAQWLWRADTASGVRYVAATADATADATAATASEVAHAERLARWYAGDQASALAAITPVTAFDGDYPYVNRLLPVWRVRFATADGLTVYVSTADERLATITNDTKRRLQQPFRAVHSWAWLPQPFRNGVVIVLLAGVALSVVLGLVLAWRGPRARRGTRRWHRLAGVGLALPLAAWVSSGFLQALGNIRREAPEAPPRLLRVAAAQLTAAIGPPPAAAQGLQLVQVDGRPVWRWALTAPAAPTGQGLAMGEHQHGRRPAASVAAPIAHHVDAGDGLALPGASPRHLAELIVHFGVVAAGEPQLVRAFTPEYGFLFKRLPVWRVEDAEGHAWFIDAASERLAARISPGERWAGAFFAYAHKWEWLTPLIGKSGRDAVSALIALAVLLLALAGAGLQWRRLRSSP